MTQGQDSPTQAVLLEVLTEREKQNERWGQQDHAPLVWLGIAGEEFGEVSKDLSEHWACEASAGKLLYSADSAERARDALRKASTHLQNSRTEWLQLAAVCVAAVESLDRNELIGARAGKGKQ